MRNGQCVKFVLNNLVRLWRFSRYIFQVHLLAF